MGKLLRSLLLFSLLFLNAGSYAQTSQEFWFAAPTVTESHGGTNIPILLRFTSTSTPANIVIDMPANPGFVPISFSMPANSSHTEDLSAFVNMVMTPSNDGANNNGLHIVSNSTITCYYEVDTQFNPEIWALKGNNGLGQEFYVTTQNQWTNGTYTPDLPYTSFDIIATEDNTVVSIYPKTNLDFGHLALTPYTVFLSKGQTYSGSVGKLNQSIPASQNPTGAVIISSKNIAVSVKDDSVNPTGWGCKDLMGDQIVPTDILGMEYIAQKGFLNFPDRVYVLAVDNNTQVSIDGVLQATLFGGQMYTYNLANPTAYVSISKPAYVYQASGFGCEVGMAILPPLNCAGSAEVSFTRSSSEQFGLNILIRSGSEGDFELNGDPNIIVASDFSPVPGNPAWVYAQKVWANGDVSVIPTGTAQRLTNSSGVFALGLINGGSTTGCRFGYFSEFSAEVIVDAGPDDVVCGNDSLQLNGDISGGSIQGFWSTSGTGTFVPDENQLDAIYAPSLNDEANGTVTLTLTSTGSCFPETDQMVVTVTPAPTIDLGPDLDACTNNPNTILTATTTVATNAIWSGGNGSFAPSNVGLSVTYQPTVAEVANGSVTLSAQSAGQGSCNPVEDFITINFTPSPSANAGSDQSVCANNPDVSLAGSVTLATGGIWSGGNGVYTPSTVALNAVYTPTPTEISNGSLTLTLTTTGNGNCNAESDQVTFTFTPAPIVTAGTDGIFCSNNADILLSGSVSGASGGQWTGGLGSYSPNSQTLNATYTPSASELAAGTVTLTLESTGNGTCLTVTDDVSYTFTPSPTVDAGTDQSVCSNNAEVSLSGSITVATGGQWSGGSGLFNPNSNNLNAIYTPTAAEIASGSMKLYLTTTGNALCLPEIDSVLIVFTPAPIANAGEDQTVCANNADVNLNGNVIGATGGIWSGGNGTFNPSADIPNPVYTPSTIEIASGSVTLIFTTSGNGNCNPVSDDILITISEAPIVNAGTDMEYCSNNADIALNGFVSGASGGVWSGGLGVFSPDNQALNAIYTPSAAEISLGTLVLTLTSTGNGSCIATEDQVTFTFGPSPVVDAGSDIDQCADVSSVPLSGSVSNAGGGQWSGGTGGFVPDAFDLNATYNASLADISSGQITLYLTSISNGNCFSVLDSVQLTFQAIPNADAGEDQSSCANNPAVQLNGVLTGASNGVWSGGNGVFNPSNTSLNATYIPSPDEIASGTVTLTLTTTGSTLCSESSDQMTIIINPSPIVSAGADQEACGNNANVQLSGSVEFAAGGIWSGGNGVFSPSATALNAIYIPTPVEVIGGNVVLTLTSTGNGSCSEEFDQVQLFYTPAPIVNAGLDQTVCANNTSVNLTGSVIGASGGIWSGGLGTFSPSNTSLNAIYEPNATEIANGIVTLTLTSTGNGSCVAESSEITISITPAPEVDAGNDVTNCVSDLNVPLNGSVSGSSTTGVWSTSGTGFFVPNNFDLSATYVISSQDSINGGAIIYLTSSNNGSCLPVVDSLIVSVFPVGLADAGNDQTVCANNNVVQLNGQISGAATSGVWSSAGSGTFSPANTILNAQYIPSDEDVIAGSVVLTLSANSCNNAADDILITYSPAPDVIAGDDQTVCITELDVQLNGFVSGGSSTGTWVSSGSGMFVPDANTLNAVYQLSAADSINQHVFLILTSTGNGNCIAVSDTMDIYIYPPGTANAGSDITTCSNDGGVQLNGSVSGGADIGQWSTSGSGTFSPNDTNLTAVYQPSDQDIINGSVSLTLTTLNSCNMANDQLILTILPGPVVTVYNDTTICGTNPVLNLIGSVQNATGGMWSTSGTGSFANNTNLTTNYTASTEDVDAGMVTINLTSTGNGLCSESEASFDLTFSTGIFVDAGEDQSVCVSALQTTLNGTINNGSSTGVWNSTGDGAFSDATDLHATYIFGPTDVASGSITFTLESTNNGNCASEADQMQLTFGNTVYVFAGDDEIFCSDINAVPLSGVISGGSSTGIWATSGSGDFVPDNTALDAIYIPSSGDSILGGFTLILSSTNNGGCLAGRDTTSIILNPIPRVDAGDDQVVCAGTDTVHLAGTALNVSQVLWISNGSGVFFPDATLLNADYIASEQDKLNGNVSFVLNSLGSDPCAETADTLQVDFAEPLTANAGDDITTCADNLSVQLDGSVGGVSTGVWTTSGSGFFFPTADVLNAQYFASPADSLSGSVQLFITTTNTMGCQPVADSLVLTIDGVPIADAGENINVCSGTEQVQLNGIIFNAASGTWGTNGTGVFSPSPNSLDAIYIFSEQDMLNGSVLLSLTAISMGVCSSAVDTMTIDMINPLVADFSWTGQCEQSTIQFSNQTLINAGTIESFEWKFGDGDQSLVENPSHIYENADTYDVQLTVHSNLGCNDSTIIQVQISSSPVAGFTWEETDALFNVQFLDASLGATQFLWDFGDNNGTSILENPDYTYSSDGIYAVTQIITNTAGCTDSLTQAVNVTSPSVFPPTTPDAFSPNGDGVNDVFFVRGGPFSKMNLKIYDGWGALVFETDNIDEGWDGTYKGEKVQIGVYIYVVDAIVETGNSYNLQGKITLIK